MKGEAVLCDFGFSRVRHEVSRTLSTVNTTENMRFLAPELLIDEDVASHVRATEASDIYAMGMTCLELGTFQHPFYDFKLREAVKMALKGDQPSQPEFLGGLGKQDLDELWKRMTTMWHKDVSQRMGTHTLRTFLSKLHDTVSSD